MLNFHLNLIFGIKPQYIISQGDTRGKEMEISVTVQLFWQYLSKSEGQCI